MGARRINIVLFLVIIFGATIIGRLVYIQILKHNFYQALAKGQHKLLRSVEPDRGEIFAQDKDGNFYILATNKETKFVFVIPDKIKDKEKTVTDLSNILDLEKDEVMKKIEKTDEPFVVIKKELNDQEIEKIKKLNQKGVYLETEIHRYYPHEELASYVLGFVGGEGVGQYGLEGFWEDQLRGEEGVISGEKSARGKIIFFDPKESLLPEEGSSLVLTIDSNIQFQAQDLLKKAREKLEFENGQIIVYNPQNGEILAAASVPGFNPNRYSDYELSVFVNPFSQKFFEPGSVFKPITLASAMEEGKITPQTTYVDEGFVKVGGIRVYNYNKRSYGECTMTEVLEKSINTGAVFAQQQISHQTFLNYIKKFGIFDKTGVDLQGEVASQNEELKKGYEINFVTASFGQGVEMTPIQLVRAFGVFATGGKLLKPHFVKKVINSNGTETEIKPEIQNPHVISQKTASQITAMLVSVVENGFGKRARVPGYYVAGKTGTAQVPWSSLGINKSGYSDKTIQTFIGFAPAFDPKFLILVKLDNPKTRTAEYSAAPLFKEMAEYIIDYYQIPPDYEE